MKLIRAFLLAMMLCPALAAAQPAAGPAGDFDQQTVRFLKPDPTENVKALNEAAQRRQDDLRLASEKLTTARLDGLAETIKLQAQHAKDLSTAESKRIDEEAALRADYSDKLAVAEAKRIDAIRAVDVAAVAVASQRASDQAQVLANQVATSAEALRALVATTATAFATAQQQGSSTLSTRITTLEQAQYTDKGRQAFSDPALLQLSAEVKQLAEANSQGTGKSEGIGASWIIFLGAGGLILMIGSFLIVLVRNPNRRIEREIP